MYGQAGGYGQPPPYGGSQQGGSGYGGGAGAPPPQPPGAPYGAASASGYGAPQPASGYGGAYGSAYGGAVPQMVASASAAGGSSRRGSVADDKLGRDPLLAVARFVKARSPKERLAMLAAAGLMVSRSQAAALPRARESKDAGSRRALRRRPPRARDADARAQHRQPPTTRPHPPSPKKQTKKQTLLFLWLTVEDHDTLFVLAEAAHFLGIGLLGYKISAKRSVAGLSLQSQLLTAAFLAVRLFCSVMMEYDIHTLLDGLTLAATLGVLAAMLWPGSPVRGTYQPDLDSVRWWVVAAPCGLLALLAHPQTTHFLPFRVLWAACVYLEAVSVLPQLRMMQNAKVVERFTAHYVFALGLSRFFSCAHWVLQLLEGNRYLYSALGSGLWPVMVLLSEVVQTFILGDFCYYYLRAYSDGTGIVRLPVGIV